MNIFKKTHFFFPPFPSFKAIRWKLLMLASDYRSAHIAIPIFFVLKVWKGKAKKLSPPPIFCRL